VSFLGLFLMNPKKQWVFSMCHFSLSFVAEKNYASAEKTCASFRLVSGKEKTHGQRENMCVSWDPWMHLTD
jgi:hypothetical protein